MIVFFYLIITNIFIYEQDQRSSDLVDLSPATITRINQLEDSVIINQYDNYSLAASQSRELISLLEEYQVKGPLLVQSVIYYGELLDHMGAYKQAIEQMQKALYLTDSITDPFIYAQILQKLGGVYSEQLEDYDLAISYLLRKISLLNNIGSDSSMMEAHHGLADIYRFQGDNKSSEYHAARAVSLLETRQDLSAEEHAHVYMAYIEILIKLGKQDEAAVYLEKVKKMDRDNPFSNYGKGYLAMVNAIYESGQKNYDASIMSFKEAESFARKLEYWRGVILIYDELIPVLLENKDYKQAYEYQKKYADIQKVLVDRNMVQAVKDLEIRYDTESKQQQLELQNAALKQNRLVIYGLITTAILFFFMIGLIYRNYRQQKKSNRMLEEQNEKIKLLIRELHHRVKNNLQVISSLLGLQSIKMEQGKAREAIEDGKTRVKAMALIHQKLYNGEEVTNVEFSSYVIELLHSLKISYSNQKAVQIHVNVPKVKFDIDTTLPLGLIMNEIISNAFKHAFEDIQEPELYIDLQEVGRGKYNLEIRDNGVGTSKDLLSDDSSSFGIRLIQMLVRQMEGTLNISNGEGTRFNVEFSVAKGIKEDR